MALESFGIKLITGMSLGVQWINEDFADNYEIFSHLIIDLFIISLVFTFSEPVTD